MKEYITLFDTHSDYETYINGLDKTLPNVSYCIDNDDVHYNPMLYGIVAKFNILDISTETKICNLPEEIDIIEIDGVQLSEPVSTYQFNTTGEHTVKYVTKSKDTIVNELFSNCDGSNRATRNGMISIEIPSKYINIGGSAFYNVNTLERIVFNTPNQMHIGPYIVDVGNNTNILQIIIKSLYIPTVSYAIGIILLGTIPGFIYVPDDLVNLYKQHADWGFVSTKIKGLSDPSISDTIPPYERKILNETDTEYVVSDKYNLSKDITLNKQINANEWTFITLPFNLTESQLKAAFGNDVQLAQFDVYDFGSSDELELYFESNNITSGLSKNKPYLIKISTNIQSVNIDNVVLDANEEYDFIAHDNGKVGSRREVYACNYGYLKKQPIFVNEGEYYITLSNKQFNVITNPENTFINAYSCYLGFNGNYLNILDITDINLYIDDDKVEGYSWNNN